MQQKQYDAAIKHFIEAGSISKAIDAAIQARQWTKAIQIVDMQDMDIEEKFCRQLAEHYATTKNYEVSTFTHCRKYFNKTDHHRGNRLHVIHTTTYVRTSVPT